MKIFFIILLFIFPFSKAICQNDVPDRPEIISASVNDTSVTINWKPRDIAPVDSYYVYEFIIKKIDIGNNVFVVDTSVHRIREEGPNTFKSTFVYTKVKKQPVKFFVAAHRSPDNNSPAHGYYHQTIFTQCSYDSCNMEVTVKWTKYVGWGNNLDFYKVFKTEDGKANQSPIGVNKPSDTILTVSVEPNKNYCFYVSAVNADPTITSFSNDTCLFTRSANAPKYINANFASFNPNSKGPVKLKFTIDPAAQTKKYQLYASDNFDSGFVVLNDPVTATSDSVIILDNTIGSKPRYYRLDALNFCGHSSTSSNIATAIIPILTTQSNEVNLTWNEYKGWYQGVNQYIIYRKIGNEPAQIIDNTATTYYSDNLGSLVGQQFSGDICYYVEAVSKPDSLNYRSTSSVHCIDLSESVFVPEGFTPNGDGRNDIFKPAFAFLPKEYTMVIYNRYGFKVFEINQPLTGTNEVKGWDGTIGSGQRAPEGAYVYFIKFVSQTGKTVERKGNFSLIYP